MDIENDTKKKITNFYHNKIKPNLDKVILAMFIVGFFLLGFFGSQIFLYYFGMIFFFAGFYAGAYGPKVYGLLFLFTHGGVGLSLMGYSLCCNYFSNPRFTDGPYFNIFVGVIAFIIILATALVFVCNLTNPFFSNDRFKKIHEKNKWYQFLPIGLYFLALVLIVVFLRLF